MYTLQDTRVFNVLQEIEDSIHELKDSDAAALRAALHAAPFGSR